MVDSDNSTSLSAVTRRQLLAGAAFVRPAAMTGRRGTAAESDVVVALWRTWQQASEKAAQLCQRQQTLETRLLGLTGYPGVVLRASDGRDVAIASLDDLDDLIALNRVSASERSDVASRLAMRWNAWQAADDVIGYSVAKRAEEEAAKAEQNLATDLLATQASSLTGVWLKLQVILQHGECCEGDEQFPWPQLHLMLDDLWRLGAADRR